MIGFQMLRILLDEERKPMTDDKLTAARRALAQIADQVTGYILEQRDSFGPTKGAIEVLVSIREIAQDAAEATLDKVETRT